MSRAIPVLAALGLCLFAAGPVAADGDRRDQDEARAAVESGSILPLETILARLKGRLPGEIVKVKLERERGVWIYEFRLVDPQGRLREIAVDAATGAVTDVGED
jgi:uncharacterized membrane protein YkoI